MTALVLDAGALIALDRNDRRLWAILRNAADDTSEVSVPAGAIAQAWRDGGARQALLARGLKHCTEVALDGPLSRASGVLCGRAATADIVDASIAVLAAARSRREDVAIVTSDPDDLAHLIEALDAHVRIIGI